MSVKVTVNLTDTAADLITGYGSGAKLYLDSATSEGGSYSNVTSTALVSGTEQYEFWDSAGTSATWYKSRVGDSGATSYSSYSDPFQATALAGYATLADLRETLAMASADTSHDNMLADMIEDVSADIDAACMRRFYRLPQVSGDTTVYADVVERGESSLVAAIGRPYFTDGTPVDIISVTTLSVRDSETSAYSAIAAGDTGYYLRGWHAGVGAYGTDWPWEDVELSPAGSYTRWPVGRAAVKVVGAFGFPTVPRPVKRAVISEARERFRQSIGGGQAPEGVNQFGTPVFLMGDSPDMRRVTRPPFSLRRMVG